MKVRLSDLRKEMHIAIQGNEEWLAMIYENFPVPAGQQKPVLTGDLTVKLLQSDADYVRVTGRISYAPFVTCSRCSDAIAWPIESKIDVCFHERPDEDESRKEITLAADEGDEYYFVDESVNIEEVVNDAVQTAIPFQTLRLCADGHTCAVCGEDVGEPRVFSTGRPEDASPFARLKNWKSND